MFVSVLAVRCEQLSSPTNGRIVGSCGHVYRSKCEFACNEGHNLLGSRTRTCQKTKVWSGSRVTCQGQCDCYVISCYDMICYVMLRYVFVNHVCIFLFFVVLCCSMPYCLVMQCVVLCCVVLFCAVLCCAVVLCYVVL